VDLSKLNGTSFGFLDMDTSIGQFIVEIIPDGYASVKHIVANKNVRYIVKTSVPGVARMEITINSSEINFKIVSCLNGYPAVDRQSCILRPKSDSMLRQMPFPLNKNCLEGERIFNNYPTCFKCSIGFVAI
jgi:hypothetical protein